MTHKKRLLLTAGLVLAGCGGDAEPETDAAARAAAPARPAFEQSRAASLSGAGDVSLSPEELERGRFDAGWRNLVALDSAAATAAAASTETLEDISPQAVNQGATQLPLAGDVAGPSVLKTQILLDRALFSPGVMDGRWGKNTEKAIYWLQRREGLRATGQVDEATFERLAELAGAPTELVRTHRLSAEDVEGPFVEIPEDIYDKADLDCLCYESLSEKLGEMFHSTPELLSRLNPDVELDALTVGTEISVPNVRDETSGTGAAAVDHLVVSDGGHYVHAVDAEGRIVYHFPSTLGSSYNPSPTGEHRVVSVTTEPWWLYQPDIIEDAEPGPDARIAPGPNNAVGMVWMALSKPHYGIHGTSAPETIGYATSSGCIRLTNWDALFLADKVSEGTQVRFTDAAATRQPTEAGG